MNDTAVRRNGTFHGGDEFFLPIVVSGQHLVEPFQFGISAVVLLVQGRD